MAVIKIGSGRFTPPATGPTGWQPYQGGTTGIFVDINTTSAGFTSTPVYLTSISGTSSHWATTGATSIYMASPTGFRVYVRFDNSTAITPALAASYQWTINWVGIEP